MTQLTEKEELFCKEFLKDLNQTQAYIRAGYTPKGANSRASALMAKPRIEKRIQQLYKKRLDAVEIDANYVLRRLVEIDQLDIADILTDEGDIRPVKEWPKAWRTTLGGMEVKKIAEADDVMAVISKLKFPDKLKNLELLGKHTAVKAFDAAEDDDEEPQPLSISFHVAPAAGPVKITNA